VDLPTSVACARNALALVFLAVPLVAQTGLGVVRGTVVDASKAVIPNAKVTLANSATGVAQTSQTNAAGIYYFGAVQIGPYTVNVEAQGFKKWEGTLTVQAGQTVVIDPSMEVGSLQAAVEVTAAAPVVATQGGQVSDTKDALRIHNLPLNGRQISNLFDLTPGVVGGGNPRTNGMKVGSTEMTLDGISYVDRFGGGISRVQPGLDTIQEFRVETAGSAAQFARPATVELVTRSGNNQIHGSAFETFRNNADGLRARQRQDGNTAAKLIRNEYGGWLGGPVVIPKIYNGKNKTFWFFDWEGMKQRQSNYAITGVPTTAMWNGDFSNMTDTSGDVFTLYDPFSTTGPNGTRTPLANNQIPQSRFNPVAKIMQSVTPTPNIGGNLNPWVEQNFQTYYPKVDNKHTWTIKIDQTFSEKDSVSGRFTSSPYFYALYGGRYGYPPPGCTNCGGSGEEDAAVRSQYVRWNHVFKPTLLNELQLSAHRSPTHYGTLGDSTNWATKLGFPNPFGVNGWPTICTDAYYMLYYGCWDGDNFHNQNLTSFQIDDNVTWIKGKHTIKAGFKGRQEYNNIQELQQAEGSHSFYSTWTSLYDPSAEGSTPYTGSGFAELLMGLPTTLRNVYNRGYFYFQQKEIGAYINDTWKLTPRLTVDLGLRWDHWNPYREKQNRLINLDPLDYLGKFEVITPHNVTMESMPNIPAGVLASWKERGLTWKTADEAHFPGALIPQYWGDFGPRLAVAYKLSDKWVLRAGYGMFYWPMPLSQILQSARGNPPLDLRFNNHRDNLNGFYPNRSLLIPPDPGSDIMPNVNVDVNGVQSLGISSRSIKIFDPHNWADDRMQQWTFNIEHELMRNTSLRLSYIGNHGSNLEQLKGFNTAESQWNYQTRTGLSAPVNADLRRLNPNWQGSITSHVGYSNSHSFQAEVQRRFDSGLSFQWFYVYDHVLTTTDEGGFGSGSGGATAPETNNILGDPNLTLSQRLKLVYYNSNAVPPHQIKWNGIYELPLGRGKRFASHVSRGLNQVVGGWQLAFIGTWRSGFWMGPSGYMWSNPKLDPSQRLTMNIFGHNQQLYFRGDFDPTQATGVDSSKLAALVPVDRSQRALHPIGSDFSGRLPFKLADGTVRNTGVTDLLNWTPKNFLLGPRMWNEDFSIFKYFDITETVKLRITSDFFNLFNHPNDGNPNGSTGLLNLSVQSNEPRIIQFSARLEF